MKGEREETCCTGGGIACVVVWVSSKKSDQFDGQEGKQTNTTYPATQAE